LTAKAEVLLADKEIKELFCSTLDAAVNLPISAADKLTSILYKLALEDDEKVLFNSMLLFAIVCRKIAKDGIHIIERQTIRSK
jgi:hypothetical protein